MKTSIGSALVALLLGFASTAHAVRVLASAPIQDGDFFCDYLNLGSSTLTGTLTFHDAFGAVTEGPFAVNLAPGEVGFHLSTTTPYYCKLVLSSGNPKNVRATALYHPFLAGEKYTVPLQ